MGADASQTALVGEIGSSFFTLPGTGVLAFLRRSQAYERHRRLTVGKGVNLSVPLCDNAHFSICFDPSRNGRTSQRHTLRDGNGQPSLLPKR